MKLGRVPVPVIAATVLLSFAPMVRADGNGELPCPPGNVWIYRGNAKACIVAPPQSQADCPPGSRFTVTSTGPGCTGTSRGVPTDAWPPVKNCQQDSDCGGGVCGEDGYCYVNPDNP